MKLHFIKANPCENTTVFILDPVQRGKYAEVCRAVMSYGGVGAEQVGFLIRDPGQAGGWRMEMAGGEFCGNGTRSFAAWLALCPGGGSLRAMDVPEKEVTVSVSGTDRPLRAKVRRTERENCCDVSVDMPLPRRLLAGRNDFLGEYVLADFEGICHAVLFDREPGENDLGWAGALLASEGLCPDATGIMYYRTGERYMRPLVQVAEVGSVVWERSCGSGSAALAAALALRSGKSLEEHPVRQPGGELRVSAEWSGGEVRRLRLGGVIEFTAAGELFV